MSQPRRGRPPLQDAADTRDRIVEAATELFATKGFHGTGVAEIGTKADVQRGALYYHIKSKEDLLWEILRDYVTVLLTDAEKISETSDDPTTKLHNLIRSHVTLIVKYQREVGIQIKDAGALTGESAAKLQDLRDRVQQLWQRVLDDGCAAGDFRTSDHVVTNSLLGLVNMVWFWYRPGGSSTTTEIAETIAAMVFDGIITRD
jgi:TetR/AcrR family transcriptional regulator, cholesterol catabolism regulator